MDLPRRLFEVPAAMRRIRSRNFKWKSGTGINMFASAHDFPKFVKMAGAM
jgi:hypothetical protein